MELPLAVAGLVTVRCAGLACPSGRARVQQQYRMATVPRIAPLALCVLLLPRFGV
jgi:hypothetical protein